MKRSNWMLVGLCLAVATLAQDKPVEAPVVPDAVKVKILRAQLDQQVAARKFQDLNQQAEKLKADYTKAQAELQAAEAAAYLEAKVDRKEWTLDDTADPKFVPVPKPEAKVPAAKPVASTVKP